MKPVAIEYELENDDIEKLDAVMGISCNGVKCSDCPLLLKGSFGGDICLKEILQIVKERRANGD